jgi:ABC-2 type transport system permease protein
MTAPWTGRILAVMRKEVRHILRDAQTLAIVIAMPVIMMFLYGYALTLDIRDLPTLIEDPAPCSETRAIARAVDATTMFKVVGTVPAFGDLIELFRKYHVKAVIRFPAGFGADLRNGGTAAPIQVLIDGSDQNTATIVRNVAGPLIQDEVLDLMHIDPPKPLTVDPVVLYNQEQKSALFFVPGLMALLLMMISALLTSLTITREKERGTMEQLLVSPLRPWEVIAGKIIPYLALAAIDGVIILVVARISFGVHIHGSVLFLAAASTVYVIVALMLGLIFSTVAKTQQQAMLMALPATLLPVIILSGFIFPRASRPAFFQWLSNIIPATFYLQLVRGIILKGVGPLELWQPCAALCCIGLVFFGITLRLYRVRL